MKYLLLLGVICFSGCTIFDTNESEFLVEVVPEAPSYIFNDTTNVRFDITNVSSEPIYYGGCDQQHVEVLIDRSIVDDFVTTRACLCICIVTIEPGETVQFFYGLPELQQAESDIAMPRFYRVWPVFYRSNNFNTPIDRDQVRALHFFLED